MAGIGSAWGTREEMLHPRDRHGRFRKKWKMAASVVDALSRFLDSFQPRTFQSDQQASQYSFNHRKAPWTTPELQRLHTDWDDANESLQAGEMDDTTKKFVDMMDRNMVETTDHLIVSQTVPTEAFGLSPQQAAMEDGGLEDLIGLEIADAGYSAANLGSELSHPPGSVTLRVAVPKGTRVAYGGRSPSDRALIFDRDQPLVVTKVESDGRGGWYMLAIAGSGSKTKGATAVAQDRTHGRRGGGLTPEQREARVSPQMSGEERLRIAQQNEREMQTGPSAVTPAPGAATTPTPAPAAPASSATPAPPAAGVPERREPVLKDSVGPGSPEGKSASDIATDAEAAKVQAENAPPTPPAPPTPLEFQEAARTLPIPTSGPQRNEWNRAHRDLAQGRRDPGDVLRELDTDIEENKRKAASATHAEKKDSLERNIQAQEQLADLIAEKYGVQRQVSSTPVARKAPAATPGAPSTARGAAPKVKAPEAAPDRRTKAQLLEEAGDAGRPRMTKDQLRQAIEAKKGGGEAPTPAPAKKAATPRAIVAKKAAPEPAAPPQTPTERLRQANRESGVGPGSRDGITRQQLEEANRVPGNTPPPSTPAKKVAAPAKVAAKKAVPAKAAPSPENAAEEAFKARVAEAGLPDKVADLKAMARDQKIRGFSTMNKKQLQSALLGDEVPKAGKIAPVTPAKLVPHLEAVESDQAARKLLENHTLADLKELAKSRDIEIPKRGATKERLKDMILTDVRGVPEGGLRQEVKESLTDEIKATGLDISGDDANSTGLRRILGEVDDQDPEDLRLYRDRLEKLAASTRELGDRQGADIFQDVADMMGMRAQRISGVEEPALPVKRVAKKAVPEADADVPEVPKTLDKMLKPELEAIAAKEGVPGVRKSMTKAQLKDAIERNRRMDSSRGGETDEERLRRELGQLPGGPERDLGPNQGPLRLPDRAPTPEEIARDAAPETPVPAKKATKKAAKKAEADVGRAAETLGTQMKGTFGDQIKATDPDEMRDSVRAVGLEPKGKTSEEVFDNALKDMLENRMRELGMLPEDPKKPTKAQKRVPKGSVAGPKADVPIATSDRRRDFIDSWNQQPGFTDDESMVEIRDRIADGELTHEEGVRRLESEIAFNEEEISDLGAELRGMAPEDRDPEGGTADSIHARRAELSDKITAQKKAVKFLRGHAKNEAPVTREELEVKLDPEEQAALQRLQEAGPEGIADMKRAAKDEGLGDIQGDDLDTVVQNISKAVADRELKARAAKKTAPAAVPEAPATARSINAAALRPGTRILAMQDSDGRWTRTSRKTGSTAITVDRIDRAQVGNQSGYQIHGTDDNGNKVTMDPIFGQNTLTPAPVGAPKATKKAAKAAGTVDVPGLLEQLNNNDNPMSREDAGALVADLDRTQLQEMAKSLGIPAGSRRTIPDTRRSIVDATVGRRLDSIATRGFRGDRPGAPEPDLPEGAPARQLVESHEVTRTPLRLPPKPVVDLDNPTRHDAELIGTGLDLDAKGEDKQWLAVVQKDLDNGVDGRQIADGLRREADSMRTIFNVGDRVLGAEPDTGRDARINRMELMADRLEGVRPIKKAEPPKKGAAEAVRPFDTMQAASAASKARSDLRSGKSHAEVATALRTAATGVGSRDHDPHMTSRVGDPTPSEKSAMKRRDAKMLRDLAAEIQAEGVAQRAAAKAAKKAPAKKAVRPAGVFSDDAATRAAAVKEMERFEAEVAAGRAAAKKATVNPNLSSLSDDELRKIVASDQFPQSQKDKVQGELDARARKNLTGVTGELVKAQLDDAMRRLQEADTPAAEDSALAGLLTPELRQLAQRLGLDSKGSKATLLQRIKDRAKGREAPGASAERAVPKAEAPSVGAVNESVPMQPYSKTDNMRMHVDSPTMGLVKAYEAAGRNGSANEMLDLRRRATAKDGSTTPQQVVDELKAMRARETDPKFQRELDRAISANDSPMTPMPDLPANTPPAARDLIERLHAIPYARKGTGEDAAIGTVSGDSLVNQVADVLRQLASGESRQQPEMRLRQILTQKVHEMNEPSFRIWELADLLEPVTDAQGRRRPSPLTLALREMRPK